MLDDEGRALLRRFGVFTGSFDLRAAEAVGQAPLSVLSDLVAKNRAVSDLQIQVSGLEVQASRDAERAQLADDKLDELQNAFSVMVGVSRSLKDCTITIPRA